MTTQGADYVLALDHYSSPDDNGRIPLRIRPIISHNKIEAMPILRVLFLSSSSEQYMRFEFTSRRPSMLL